MKTNIAVFGETLPLRLLPGSAGFEELPATLFSLVPFYFLFLVTDNAGGSTKEVQ
jgi:hypothetical protein